MTNNSLFRTTFLCTSIHRRTARSSLPVDDTGAPVFGHGSLQYRGSSRRPGSVYTTPMPRSPASLAMMTESSIKALRVSMQLDTSTPSALDAQWRSIRRHHFTSRSRRFWMSSGRRRCISMSHSDARCVRPACTSPDMNCSLPSRLRSVACSPASVCSDLRPAMTVSRSSSAKRALDGSALIEQVLPQSTTPR